MYVLWFQQNISAFQFAISKSATQSVESQLSPKILQWPSIAPVSIKNKNKNNHNNMIKEWA